MDAGGEAVIDADGAYVTPGLIESHTHFDAGGVVGRRLRSDARARVHHHGAGELRARPGTAPAGRIHDLVDLFAFIEDIPAEAFNLAVPWAWDTWPEYFAAARATRPP